MPKTPNLRLALIVAVLVAYDACLLARLVADWGTPDCDRGHNERLNGCVVWVYDA
jgi:hypothetical protein